MSIPQAIPRVLEPCSREKVRESEEEYPIFKSWVQESLPKYSEVIKKFLFLQNSLIWMPLKSMFLSS
jgi:hypothetical protein